MATLIAVIIAFVASLIASFAGMGAIGGKDIGFAGVGLWFVMIPASLLGMLLAFAISRFLRGPEHRNAQRLVFVIASPCIAAILGALPIFFLLNWSNSPEFVFVAAPGYSSSVVLSAPPEVKVGEPLVIKAIFASGPWTKVRYAELHGGEPYLPDPRPAEAEAIGRLHWQTIPDSTQKVVNLDPVKGEATMVFESPGTFEVSARMYDPGQAASLIQSNALSVVVRPANGERRDSPPPR